MWIHYIAFPNSLVGATVQPPGYSNTTFCSDRLSDFSSTMSLISLCQLNRDLVLRITGQPVNLLRLKWTCWKSACRFKSVVCAWQTRLTFSNASFRLGIGCSRGRGSGKRGHIISDLALRPIPSSRWYRQDKGKREIKSRVRG